MLFQRAKPSGLTVEGGRGEEGESKWDGGEGGGEQREELVHDATRHNDSFATPSWRVAAVTCQQRQE